MNHSLSRRLILKGEPRPVLRSITNLGRRAVVSIRMLPFKLAHRSTFSAVSTFVFFIGYPRSGHTLFGSMLNAHPNTVLAHELHALHFVRAGLPRDMIYDLILKRDQDFQRSGRQWSGYDYTIPGQWQGRYSRLDVIGDKKASGSTLLLGKYPGLLDTLRTRVGVPIKVIHYVRNPFDNITTMTRYDQATLTQAILRYFCNATINRDICGRLDNDEVLTLHHEDTVTLPRDTLRTALTFLGVVASDAYVESCASVVFPRPRRTRFDGSWTQQHLEEVQTRCSEFEFLSRYSFYE